MGKICDRFEILHKACVRRTIDNIVANSEAVARRPPAQGLHGGECGARRGTARPRPGSVANGHRTAYGQRYIESWVDGQRQLLPNRWCTANEDVPNRQSNDSRHCVPALNIRRRSPDARRPAGRLQQSASADIRADCAWVSRCSYRLALSKRGSAHRDAPARMWAGNSGSFTGSARSIIRSIRISHYP